MVIRGYRFAIVLMRITILYSYYHNIFQHLSHASRLEEVLDDSMLTFWCWCLFWCWCFFYQVWQIACTLMLLLMFIMTRFGRTVWCLYVDACCWCLSWLGLAELFDAALLGQTHLSLPPRPRPPHSACHQVFDFQLQPGLVFVLLCLYRLDWCDYDWSILQAGADADDMMLMSF